MSEPMSQAKVEAEIMRLSGLAEAVTHKLRQRAEACAQARTEYDVAYAKALLLAEGSVPAREAQATVETEDLLLAKRTAEALEKAAQEAGRNYRAQLDSLRSINANLRPLTVAS